MSWCILAFVVGGSVGAISEWWFSRRQQILPIHWIHMADVKKGDIMVICSEDRRDGERLADQIAAGGPYPGAGCPIVFCKPSTTLRFR